MKSNSDLARFSASYFGLQPIEVVLVCCNNRIRSSLPQMRNCVDLRVYGIHCIWTMISQKVLNISSSSCLFWASFSSEPILNGYLVLEDLNKSYVHPCILDVKIGTRTYCTFHSYHSFPGDGAPPQKIERHIRMCKSTTSGSLGIRVCGMRVISPNLLHDRCTARKAMTGWLKIKNGGNRW